MKTTRYIDLGLLVLRLGFGLGFVFFHGWSKLVGGPEAWERIGGAMGYLGIDFGHVIFGFLAAVAESVGGLLLALGLFTRPVAAALAFTMVMAAWHHWASDTGTPAHAFKNIFVFAALMLTGPGKIALKIGRR